VKRHLAGDSARLQLPFTKAFSLLSTTLKRVNWNESEEQKEGKNGRAESKKHANLHNFINAMNKKRFIAPLSPKPCNG
jgi:hypothetical protein